MDTASIKEKFEDFETAIKSSIYCEIKEEEETIYHLKQESGIYKLIEQQYKRIRDRIDSKQDSYLYNLNVIKTNLIRLCIVLENNPGATPLKEQIIPSAKELKQTIDDYLTSTT